METIVPQGGLIVRHRDWLIRACYSPWEMCNSVRSTGSRRTDHPAGDSCTVTVFVCAKLTGTDGHTSGVYTCDTTIAGLVAAYERDQHTAHNEHPA